MSTLSTENDWANFYLSFAALSLFTLASSIWGLIKIKKLNFSNVDIIIACLLLYVFLHHHFYNLNELKVTLYKGLFLYSVTFFLLRILFKKLPEFSFKAIIYTLLFSVLFNCILVLNKIINKEDPLSFIQNVFGNSGIFSILLSISYVISFYLLFDWKNLKKLEKLVFSITCLSGVLFSIFLNSRTALLTIILFSIFIVYNRLLRNRLQISYLVFIGTAIVSMVIAAFCFKVDSSQGRLLIWKTSLGMISDYFPFGSGANTFSCIYPNYQAACYNHDKMSDSQVLLAGNSVTAFNEPLEIICELGLVGLFSLLFIFQKILKVDIHRNNLVIKFGALGLLFASLFYYVFHSTILLLILLLFLSYLFSMDKPLLSISGKWVKLIFCVILVLSNMTFYTFQLKYTSIKSLSNLQSYKGKTLEEYRELYNHLSDNPVFIYIYANELYKNDKPKESLQKLNLLSKHITWYDSEVLAGDSYLKIDEIENAEKHYKKAISICPGKFNARHKLFNAYVNTGNDDKAKELAIEIVNLPEKIPSAVTLAIKLEAESYLNTN